MLTLTWIIRMGRIACNAIVHLPGNTRKSCFFVFMYFIFLKIKQDMFEYKQISK